MEKYQQNLDTEEIDNSDDIEFTIKSYPFIFSNNYDKYKYHENGNKIILPKYILYEISKYKNISFPITLVCNNIYIGVLEFEEFIESAYISKYLYNVLKLDLNNEDIVSLKIIKDNLNQATSIKIKPKNEEFYTIPDKKKYLEIHLKKQFTCLMENTTISVPFKDYTIQFDIIKCLPNNVVMITDVDDLEVEIEPMIEKKDNKNNNSEINS